MVFITDLLNLIKTIDTLLVREHSIVIFSFETTGTQYFTHEHLYRQCNLATDTIL